MRDVVGHISSIAMLSDDLMNVTSTSEEGDVVLFVTVLQLWGTSIVVLLGLFISLSILYCISEATRERWNGSSLSPIIRGMTVHERELFLSNLQNKPYVGDDYLFPGGRFGLPPGMIEDYLRVMCNYHTLLSVVQNIIDHWYHSLLKLFQDYNLP